MFEAFLALTAVMAVVAGVLTWGLICSPPSKKASARPLTREERAQNMLVVADEHDKRSFEAGIGARPTERQYHSNRADALRKEAAKLLDEPFPLCPDAATREDYR